MPNSDKRKAERLRLALPVLYANLSSSDDSYRYLQSSSLDISATGLGIVLPESVDPHDLIQLVLILPVNPFIITGLAKTMWTQQTDDDPQRAGLHFVQLPPELTQQLIDQLTAVFSQESTLISPSQ